MAASSIKIHDQAVNAVLDRISAAGQNMQPVLRSIGEDVNTRIKQRFETGIGPDGQRWKPNSAATYDIVSRRLSKGNLRKDGRLNARGAARISSKRPLHGETGELARQFNVDADGHSVSIGSLMGYAAMQHFGGVTSEKSMIPGKTIPARPFFPITAAGELYPSEQKSILDTLNDYLEDVIDGKAR